MSVFCNDATITRETLAIKAREILHGNDRVTDLGARFDWQLFDARCQITQMDMAHVANQGVAVGAHNFGSLAQ